VPTFLPPFASSVQVRLLGRLGELEAVVGNHPLIGLARLAGETQAFAGCLFAGAHESLLSAKRRVASAVPRLSALLFLAQRRQHVGLRGKAAVAVLGEEQLAVERDVENPAAALDELRLDAERLLDRGRQTGSPGQVVSGAAVGNGDVHGRGGLG